MNRSFNSLRKISLKYGISPIKGKSAFEIPAKNANKVKKMTSISSMGNSS